MTNPTNKQTAETFWGRIHVTSDEAWACWAWPGKIYANGYGMVRWHGDERYAHHIAWITTRGALLPLQQVLHHCDNRECVRPDHLFPGTASDNARDMYQKRRHAQHKLSPEKVRAMRDQYARGFSVAWLAGAFSVSDTTVRHVLARRRFAWVE